MSDQPVTKCCIDRLSWRALPECGRTLGEGKGHVLIRRAGGKAVISRLEEGAIDGANLRNVEFREASGLLLARDQTARKYVADTTL